MATFTARVNYASLTVLSTRETSPTIKLKVKENTVGLPEMSIKEKLKMVYNRAEADTSAKAMILSMKDNSIKVKIFYVLIC
jgi:hypothetical protein